MRNPFSPHSRIVVSRSALTASSSEMVFAVTSSRASSLEEHSEQGMAGYRDRGFDGCSCRDDHYQSPSRSTYRGDAAGNLPSLSSAFRKERSACRKPGHSKDSEVGLIERGA
jgi:hypothetical protein